MRAKLFVLSLIVLGIFAGFANAQVSSFASSVAHQPRASFQAVYGSDDRLNTYWPILGDKESCLARQDLLLQVSPGGCAPSVVRSDLLAEQNVPVFCQIDALQINPLIDIEQIRSISFSSKYPRDVIGAGFHPARAALRSRDKLLGSPLINNIGYVVVVLKKNPAEKDLPNFVNVNLSARIDYEADNAFGVGRAEFVLSPSSDYDWEQTDERFRNSFWNGRYFVRLEQADPNFAVVSIYSGQKGLLGGIGKIASVRVERGSISSPIYVPGAYCRAGLEVAYDGFVSAENMATIVISDDKGTDSLDVYEGSRFLNDRCSVNKIIIDETNSTGGVSIKCSDGKRHNLVLRSNFTNATGRQDKDLGSLNMNFDDAIASLEKVVDEYSAEKERNVEGAESYGERALIRAIKLSALAGKERTRVRLISKFVERYPDSGFAEYRHELNRISEIDFSDSTDVLNVDNKFWNVRLTQLKKPKKESFVELSLTGASAETAKIDLKELKNFTGGIGTLESIKIDNIVNEEEIAISANCRVSEEGGKFSIKGSSFRLKLFNDATKVCDKSFVKLKDVVLERNAKIRLVPRSQGTRTETNLSINIGIEKRAIKLSTEKTEELIENLNKSVKRWEEINNNLGKVVEGLKGACFATSAVLTVTNFLTGIEGEALARQKVMVGWTKQCSDLVSKGDYPTINACYLDNANKIKGDVRAANEVINGVNNKIDSIEKNFVQKGTGLFGGDSVDRSKAAVDYCNDLKNGYGERDVKTSQGVMKFKDLLGDCEKGYNEQGLYGYNELREMEYNLLMQEKSTSEHIKNNSGTLLESSYAQILNNKEGFLDVQKAQKARELGLPAPAVMTSSVQKNVVAEVVSVSRISEVNLKELVPSADTHLASVNVYNSEGTTINNIKREGFTGAGENYYLGLVKNSEGHYDVQDVFRKKESSYEILSTEKKREFLDIYGIGRITSAETVSYVNSYKNPEVRYYETEPYKGMPAIVPFDIQSGWYAATRQTLPTFGGIGAFDASGRVTSFYLCNVGPNGNEQFFEGYGDDICQLINLNTGQPLGFFPGLSEQEARRKVGEAVLAIQDAASQFGKKRVAIRGRDFFVGRPAANIPSTQCQNFMSPEECHLLFNVCDPVICPSSRCDFGGKYPVADVVQTGIIGSTLLCLPNVREKIIVPVCLTGIHAGIDGFVSILKNHRDCLQESLATGRSVGICDQIYSIYLCEFFWRQAAPVAKVVLPKIIETAYGQGTRGGGEYLTASAAWENTQNSINYFTQSYAVNSINAFKARSIEEVGTPICRAFVSVKAPTSFKTLVEPESPPQFHAWFSATRYTDATVPATSQYKVFYHIFAGKDQGVHYSVYLKNPPESSFFTLPAIVHVASGFVGRGQYSSESRDFTAPEGYKELCVRVNDIEECGFKQVSTSFALNYLRDSYVSDELKESQIKSEKECVSGSTNLGAVVLNPNLQAGVEEALLPFAYERGVVRICSTGNPGSQTDPTRFVEMGYCDDQRIKCWLDKQSVANAITDNNKGLRNATLSEIETRQRADLAQKGIIVGDDTAVAEIKQLKEVVDGLRGRGSISERELNETAIRLDALFKKVVLNHHKANLLYLIGDLRAIYVEKEINKIKLAAAISNAAEKIVGEARSAAGGTSGTGGEVKYLLSGEYDGNKVINIIQRKDGSDRVFLSIDKGRVYTLTPKILIGNVQQTAETSFSINLLNSNSFDEFYDFIKSKTSTNTLRETAEDYYTFRNAVIKGNTIELKVARV